jgi:hypothetical protein
MPRERSIARHDDMISAKFSTRDANDHNSLGSDQKQTSEAYASSYDGGSLSAIRQ